MITCVYFTMEIEGAAPGNFIFRALDMTTVQASFSGISTSMGADFELVIEGEGVTIVNLQSSFRWYLTAALTRTQVTTVIAQLKVTWEAFVSG